MQCRLFAATTVHHGEDVSFNSIMEKCNLADPALLLGEIVCVSNSHPANLHPAEEDLRSVAGR